MPPAAFPTRGSHPLESDGGSGVLQAHGRFLDLPRGRWDSGDVRGAELIIVVSGVVLIEHGAAPTSSAEILGPGDACTIDASRATGPGAAYGALIIEPARLYALVHPLAGLLADWPPGGARLIDVLLERHRRRNRHQAILGFSRVEDRVLLVLWALAERFGEQVPDGALLTLKLTHQMLGCLTAARRPTVTTALGVLRTAGLVCQTSGGGLWVSAEAAELERTGRRAPREHAVGRGPTAGLS